MKIKNIIFAFFTAGGVSQTFATVCPVDLVTDSSTQITASTVNCVVTINSGVTASLSTANTTTIVVTSASGASVTNNGTVTSGLYIAISNSGGTSLAPNTITNNGNINVGLIGISNSGYVSNLTNSGSITSGVSTATGISNNSTISNLTNIGSINVSGWGIRDYSVITNLINSGSIAAGQYGIRSSSTNVLTNAGSITGGTFGIHNVAPNRINTLNNAQGGTISGATTTALTYSSKLPASYNIIVSSPTHYGQLAVTSPAFTTNFGIYSGGVAGVAASALAAGTYSSVITGITLSNLTGGVAPTGTYGSYNWALNNSSGTIWDLVVTCVGSCASGGGGSGNSSGGGSSTSPVPSSIIAGSRTSLSSLGLTSNVVLAGGTLVLSEGDISKVAISVTGAGGVIQHPTFGTAALAGVISGSGAITFDGSGTTVLSGVNTYSGGTLIANGILSVAGSSPTGSGDIVVLSPSTLMGNGTIDGNIIVYGVLKPGNSPGYLAPTKNVTFNPNSTYQQDIAGTAQASSTSTVGSTGYYSFLNIGGQLIINSGATLAPRLSNLFSTSEAGYGSSIYVPALGDQFLIATAAGGISGRFTTLTQPAELSSGTQLIAFYNFNNNNSVELVTVPTSYSTTLSSSTTNAKSVAGVFDKLLGVNKAGTSSSKQDSLLYVVAGQTAASLPTFTQALTGEIHAASVATVAQSPQRVQQSVLARIGDYPMAPSQINPALNNALLTGGISATNTSGLPTASMSTNPAVNPNTVNVTSAAVADGRAWGEIAYQRAERASNSAGNGFNSNLYQIVTGVDAYSNAELGLKLGGGIALSNTSVSANGGNSTIQQGSLFVYGKMSVLQDYVLDGMASVGMSSTNLSRNDPTGYTGGFSSKAVLGNDALVSVGLSRAFEYNDVRITPYARLSYQYVGQNSYDEGSGAAALNIARFSGSAVRGVIGVAAGSLNKNPLKDDYTYRANVAVGADTSGLLNPTLNTTLGGYSSSVTTASAGSAFVQVGLYGTVKIADNAYAYAGVSGEARTGQTLYGGSVGLRLAF